MKRAFLEGIRSGIEVDRWIALKRVRLLRCYFNRKGAVVLYLD